MTDLTDRAIAAAFTDVAREYLTTEHSHWGSWRTFVAEVEARAAQYAAEERTAEMAAEGRALTAKLGEGEG